MYNILEARVEYKNQKLERVTVLVEISQGDVRGVFSSNNLGAGYMKLHPNEPITDGLLQRVAGYGATLLMSERDTVFPNWKAKYIHNTGSNQGIR